MASAWCWAGMCVCGTGPFSVTWIPHTGLRPSVCLSGLSGLPLTCLTQVGVALLLGAPCAQTVLSAPSSERSPCGTPRVGMQVPSFCFSHFLQPAVGAEVSSCTFGGDETLVCRLSCFFPCGLADAHRFLDYKTHVKTLSRPQSLLINRT